MPTCVALQSFDDGKLGKVKRGAVFELSEAALKPYKENDLLDYCEHPQSAAAKSSSALPAARVSRQTTPKKSGSGAKQSRKKGQ